MHGVDGVDKGGLVGVTSANGEGGSGDNNGNGGGSAMLLLVMGTTLVWLLEESGVLQHQH
ncbi:hypothetical protein ABBQ38_012410 [Trebouxia sp. C0009 RCD-2024]